MKVLLISINAKYIHTNNAVRLLKANSSFNPKIMEYTIKDQISGIADDINASDADVIGCSVYIWNVNIFKALFKQLSLTNKVLILGGPEVSYEASHFLQHTPADFVIKGEGEFVFESLLHAINNKTSYSHIQSLAYKQDGKILQTPIQEIKDLSTLKAPYFFKDDIKHIPNRIAYIESSRGCPYKCSYCLSSLEKTVRFFPLDYVKKSILYLMEQGTKTIKFLDRTFNANKNTMDLLKFIIDNNNYKTVFQFEITGDILDPKIIHYINTTAPKGLFRFEIGIQSVNYETNYLVDRLQDNDKLFNNIRLIEDKGVIALHLDLIAGLPMEDKDSFINTFDTVFKLGAKELQLGFLKMLRGTKIRLEADKYNYVYKDDAPYEIIRNNVLSESDIEEIHLVEHMLELYHNKGYFRGNMLELILNQKSPYVFFKTLGNHFINKGYSFKGFQIEDIYKRLFDIIDLYEQFKIKQDYLKRSKIKPKIFFENNITKETKNIVYSALSEKHNIPINTLYKHSVLINHQDVYVCALYQQNSCQLFHYQKKD